MKPPKLRKVKIKILDDFYEVEQNGRPIKIPKVELLNRLRNPMPVGYSEDAMWYIAEIMLELDKSYYRPLEKISIGHIFQAERYLKAIKQLIGFI